MMIMKNITLGLIVLLSSAWLNAQVCQSNIPESTLTSRFVDQKDGTVRDSLTHLVWKRCSEGQDWDADHSICTGEASLNTWQQALNHVQALNSEGGYAGQSDWRLPNNKELESIVSLHCVQPAINLQVFPNTAEHTTYWSSTPYLYSLKYGDSVWVYKFDQGSTSVVKKGGIEMLRLVRGGSD